LHLSWPGKQECDPILPFKVRRFEKYFIVKANVSERENRFALFSASQLKCKALYPHDFGSHTAKVVVVVVVVVVRQSISIYYPAGNQCLAT
jgi:hypothetical protein